MIGNIEQKVNKLIQHFSKESDYNFQLINGVCSIYSEENNEIVTIEFPSNDKNLFFNCTLSQIDNIHDTMLLSRLMRLNLEMKAMQGCWLALDEEQHIILCYLLPVTLTDEEHFCHVIEIFIEQVFVLRPLIEDLKLLENDKLESDKNLHFEQ